MLRSDDAGERARVCGSRRAVDSRRGADERRTGDEDQFQRAALLDPAMKTRQKLAHRALERQLDYQQKKADTLRGHEDEVIAAMQRSSQRVREKLEQFGSIAGDTRVIEVGSGAHGLIFYFGARAGIGIDPLAVSYRNLFPRWQTCATTIAAVGEQLPFCDQSFDIVLCDNVVDHAESPQRIASELVRILKPGGLLYFTVNFHHRVYALAAGGAFCRCAGGGGGSRGAGGGRTAHTMRV